MPCLPRNCTLRTRLYLSVVLTVGLTCGALAGTTYLLVREGALSESADDARADRRLAVSLAKETLSADASGDEVRSVLRTLEYDAPFEATILVGDRSYSTASGLGLRDVPKALRAPDARHPDPVSATIANEPYTVVGADVQDLSTRIFLFYPQQQIHDQLRKLAAVLGSAWIVTVAVAALVGRRVSATVLRPFTQVVAIACSIAAGKLNTRLSVGADDEVGSMVAAINEMADSIEQKIQELERARDRERRFRVDAAHELRTPVGSLVAEASLLRGKIDDLPSHLRRPVALMLDDLDRLDGLVKDLLELHRVESGIGSPRMESIDLRPWLKDLLRRCGWEHRVELPSSTAILHTDGRSLERVIVNLIDNAIEHGRHNVRAEVEEDADDVLIRVSDGGDGIPKEHIRHLFEPLYKVDPSRSNRGVGLGLSIAAQHARLIRATIDVESREGDGSTFTVRLPRSPVSAEARAGSSEVTQKARVPGRDSPANPWE